MSTGRCPCGAFEYTVEGPLGDVRYCHCAKCGSPLYARSDHDPDDVRVRLGGFEGPLDARITAHVWVGSKAPGYEIEDSLPCHSEAIPARR